MTRVQSAQSIKTNFIHVVLPVSAFLFGDVSMAASTKRMPEHKASEGASKVFEDARERIYQICTLTADGDAENSTVSGFLIGQNELIATSWPFISDAILDPARYRLEAIRIDGRRLPISVVTIDATNDLALLKAADESDAPFTINKAPQGKGDMGCSLGDPKSHDSFAGYRHVLLEDNDGVGKVIRTLANHHKREPRSGVFKLELAYFRGNRSRTDYTNLRAQNLPIGSRVIEATCKTIVTQRMKRSGQRRSIDGGQAILSFRVLAQSDRFDAAWQLVSAAYRGDILLPENVVPINSYRISSV